MNSRIVPTLCVGMQPWTLRVHFSERTRSILTGVLTLERGNLKNSFALLQA